MQIAKTYEGREHALIKHKLLESYLETALSIIGVTKVPAITYVDCFAGPWGSDTKTLEGTSISISLRILQKVRLSMLKMGMPPIAFKAIYVEKDKKSFERLSAYLAENTPEGIKSVALEGDYFDQQDEILKICGKSFSFFFIDPKGWLDVSVSRLSKLLRRQHSEFLINFMYDFVNRAVGMEKLRERVESLLGALNQEDLNALKSFESEERGDFLVRRYREMLKIEMGAGGSHRPRSYHAKILNKDKERTHYHLVYLTRHPKGIVKFAQESTKADYLQSLVRIEKRRNSNPQGGLFTAEQEVETQAANQIVMDDVKRILLSKLSTSPTTCDEKFLADILEETGWFTTHIDQAFHQLIKDGKVQNLDATKLRPKRPVHFEKRERLTITSN